MSTMPNNSQYVPATRRATTQELAPMPNVDYISVFQKCETFDEMLRGAELFAKSVFVPKDFQGNPGNCLIAMDLAFSLGIKPTAIFPHLYVINGRPALSAQFMIALVNRSGQFSRIQWDEGADGFVEFEAYGKTRRLPNYWAQAHFTELATGETFYSTRVDLELARANGWLTKNESKWKTIPREMCRWRSASWLAKNYCPEAILGLEFADEVADYDAVPEPTRLTRRPARKIIDVEIDDAQDDETLDADALEKLINGAKNNDELQKAGAAVAAANVSDADKERLRRAFRMKNAQLAQADAKPTEPVEEPKPKTTRKAAPKKSAPKDDDATQEPERVDSYESSIIQAINSAKSVEELRRIYDALQATAQNGEIDSVVFHNLEACIDTKSHELEGDAEETSQEANERQTRAAQSIVDAIIKAKDGREVDKYVKLADSEWEAGHITTEQYNSIAARAGEAKSKLML